MTDIYDNIVQKIALDIRSVLNHGEHIDINVSYYKEGDMTITIYDEEQSPHFYAVDIDEHGRIVQEWYKDNEDDPWLFSLLGS